MIESLRAITLFPAAFKMNESGRWLNTRFCVDGWLLTRCRDIS